MQTYRFGEFELDLDAQELRAGGEVLHLERRPMDLLVMLVSAQGRLVSRKEIIDALWPKNVIIDFESGLNTLVRKIRHALGDSPERPQYVLTVPGRGYRFIAALEQAPATPPASTPTTIPVPRPRSRRALVIALAAAAIGVFAASWFLSSARQESGSTRIAVMPFENLTGDDSLGYLASGLAEDTGTSLAHIDLPDFSVIGGMSARTIAADNLPTRQVGRQLDADYLVLSSLRRDGSRIRVTSRLVRVADDKQVWSASFDRELTNVLGLQSELSIAIAEQVRQHLSPDVAAEINRRQTSNPAAYELYLKGRHAWTQFAPDSVPRALDFYRQAVAEDPRYALAWAGIAHALSTSIIMADADPGAVQQQAEDAMQRALEYGADLGEAYLAAEAYFMFVEWDFAAAERAGRRAVELMPDNGLAHQMLGIVLTERSKFVEANQMMRRARELDPFFPLIFANSANVAISSGDPQAALDYARHAIAIRSEFWVGYLHLGNAHVALGRTDEALAAFEMAERHSGGNSKPIAARTVLMTRLGRDSEAREMLASLQERADREFVPSFTFAVVHAALGETDKALEWLERAWQEHDIHVIAADMDWQLEALRDDPRFHALLDRCRCGRAQLKAIAMAERAEAATIEPRAAAD